MTYKIIFDNTHFVIVDKNALVLSVPSREGESESRPVLGKILESDLGIPLYPVHRLDFEVQGLIIFAKNPISHKAANAWFEKKEVHKSYVAMTRPIEAGVSFIAGENFEWKSKLLRGKKRTYESPHGKDSKTLAFLSRIDEKGIFHWELNPVTGRSHQLRFELFKHGHPIIGDKLYSSNELFTEGGIALRAFKIDFSKTLNYKNFQLPEFIEIKKLN
jgi:tRNA pseudouridine32 synthase/23S rRNA pseudouridine746 synthase